MLVGDLEILLIVVMEWFADLKFEHLVVEIEFAVHLILVEIGVQLFAGLMVGLISVFYAQ
jgi:hypothetical protein